MTQVLPKTETEFKQLGALDKLVHLWLNKVQGVKVEKNETIIELLKHITGIGHLEILKLGKMQTPADPAVDKLEKNLLWLHKELFKSEQFYDGALRTTAPDKQAALVKDYAKSVKKKFETFMNRQGIKLDNNSVKALPDDVEKVFRHVLELAK